MVLPLVLLHDLVAALERLSHLQVDIKFHVVHGHLDNEVRLIDLLVLLLGLVPKVFDLCLPPLLRLLQLIL